ncbi:hypothetical protein AGABI1DRAFT_133159 [Agaricus bisporus var. burnettii JB137-S8]|uniref:Uncharacterized protein n=1 Tax=Agaricus bisporus var. burnettii (strain JB137-S8 / ATCC MYA-4627 / FGSC 10392) TaxID=597362 RepID=K5VJJ1_AGABU|nr:uncharacterized protein AGABI1DRAFT_133159 [Agaricus bisporus var. burnettii JB137-S8]EKM74519.1 hypothetical protein AGABI1DRAFT_133159 [Agaricus bisporus var. burnettii JB137-S8]
MSLHPAHMTLTTDYLIKEPWEHSVSPVLLLGHHNLAHCLPKVEDKSCSPPAKWPTLSPPTTLVDCLLTLTEGGDNHFPPARPKTPTPSASVLPEEKPVLPLPLPVIPPFIPPVIPPVTPPQIHAPLPVTPPTAGAPLEPPHVPRRTGRVRKPPAGNDSDSDDKAALLADSEFCEVKFAGAVSGADPQSYRLAMKSPDSDCWTEACNTEIFNLEANGTWKHRSLTSYHYLPLLKVSVLVV